MEPFAVARKDGRAVAEYGEGGVFPFRYRHDLVPVIIQCDTDGEGRRHVPCLLLRTPYPHDAGNFRVLVHAHLDRAIEDERSRTPRRFQRFQQRDGPDLTTVFQPTRS